MTISTLAYVTTAAARHFDADLPLLLEALDRLGVHAEARDWHDVAVDWSVYDRVVMRSAWDYPERLADFLPWVEHVDGVSDLCNRPEHVTWSMDKRYLRDLSDAGVPTTPTMFVEPGETFALPDAPAGFVVKPAIGAGGRDASRYLQEPDDRATAMAHIERLLDAGRSVMLQPFLSSIERDGEWPLVFLDGEFSHAAHKRVALPRAGRIDALFAAEENQPADASDACIAVGVAALAAVAARLPVPKYARVDVVIGDDGQPCVLELELIEPSLFLPENPDAVDRVARVLSR